jgi:hypothetical protein
MSTETLIIIALVILILAALPSWPHSRDWGYGPSGILMIIGVIVLAFILFGDGGLRRGGSDANISRPAGRGADIEGAAEEVGDGLKEAGRDLKRTVQDATD